MIINDIIISRDQRCLRLCITGDSMDTVVINIDLGL